MQSCRRGSVLLVRRAGGRSALRSGCAGGNVQAGVQWMNSESVVNRVSLMWVSMVLYGISSDILFNCTVHIVKGYTTVSLILLEEKKKALRRCMFWLSAKSLRTRISAHIDHSGSPSARRQLPARRSNGCVRRSSPWTPLTLMILLPRGLLSVLNSSRDDWKQAVRGESAAAAHAFTSVNGEQHLLDKAAGLIEGPPQRYRG